MLRKSQTHRKVGTESYGSLLSGIAGLPNTMRAMSHCHPTYPILLFQKSSPLVSLGPLTFAPSYAETFLAFSQQEISGKNLLTASRDDWSLEASNADESREAQGSSCSGDR
jgi:hypothetical protein